MANTPNRPIRYLIKVGKGRVKGRRDSDNPYRAVIEQITIQFAENQWKETKERLGAAIEQDVRAELTHTAAQFRRYVIGRPNNQRVAGTLTAKASGGSPPTQSLSGLPAWAPRGARYLEDKKSFTGNKNWFDNTGWDDGKYVGGTLKEFFSSDIDVTGGGSTMFIGGASVFEELFGGIKVQLIRNNLGAGTNAGTMKVSPTGRTQIQLARVYVRALGSVTESMMRISDQPNTAMLDQIKKTDRNVALHLRGGRGVYRPTLEPYLRFFLERALPHAVQQRIAKGTASGRLFR